MSIISRDYITYRGKKFYVGGCDLCNYLEENQIKISNESDYSFGGNWYLN